MQEQEGLMTVNLSLLGLLQLGWSWSSGALFLGVLKPGSTLPGRV